MIYDLQIKVVLLLLACLSLSSDLAASELSFQKLVRHIHDRGQVVRVLRTDCSWKVNRKGRLRESYDQVFLYDDLGRFRETQTNAKKFDADGKLMQDQYAFLDLVFDGEKTCVTKYFPHMDQHGKIVPDNPGVTDNIGSGDPEMGYRFTAVEEGSDGKKRSAVRRPFGFVAMCFAVDGAIDKAVEQGLDLQVRGIQENGKNLYVVSIPKRLIANDGPDYEAIIDPSRGWVFSRVRSLGEGRFFEASAEYTEYQDGIWIPASGTLYAWFSGTGKNRSTPDLEIRFIVHKTEMNFPVEDAAFETEVAPNSWVADTRYETVYQTGKEKVIDSDLTRLALNALEQAKKQATGISYGTQRSWKRWIIAANIGVVLLLLVLVVLRKLRSANLT